MKIFNEILIESKTGKLSTSRTMILYTRSKGKKRENKRKSKREKEREREKGHRYTYVCSYIKIRKYASRRKKKKHVELVCKLRILYIQKTMRNTQHMIHTWC